MQVTAQAFVALRHIFPLSAALQKIHYAKPPTAGRMVPSLALSSPHRIWVSGGFL
jgi:hypothetical protein